MDYKAAYDSMDRCILYTAVEEFQIPQKPIVLVKTTVKHTQCQVKIQNMLSGPIHIKYGFRQGDVLACLLFNIALGRAIRDDGINTWESIFYKSVRIMAYVDDTDITGRT
jgi:hypothetical protein